MSDLRLAWTGSYEDLKKLVGEELKLNGTWQQPGGYKKVFTYSETSISWLKDKKTLTFEGKEHRNNRYRMRAPIFSQSKICLHKMAAM